MKQSFHEYGHCDRRVLLPVLQSGPITALEVMIRSISIMNTCYKH